MINQSANLMLIDGSVHSRYRGTGPFHTAFFWGPDYANLYIQSQEQVDADPEGSFASTGDSGVLDMNQKKLLWYDSTLADPYYRQIFLLLMSAAWSGWTIQWAGNKGAGYLSKWPEWEIAIRHKRTGWQERVSGGALKFDHSLTEIYVRQVAFALLRSNPEGGILRFLAPLARLHRPPNDGLLPPLQTSADTSRFVREEILESAIFFTFGAGVCERYRAYVEWWRYQRLIEPNRTKSYGGFYAVSLEETPPWISVLEYSSFGLLFFVLPVVVSIIVALMSQSVAATILVLLFMQIPLIDWTTRSNPVKNGVKTFIYITQSGNSDCFLSFGNQVDAPWVPFPLVVVESPRFPLPTEYRRYYTEPGDSRQKYTCYTVFYLDDKLQFIIRFEESELPNDFQLALRLDEYKIDQKTMLLSCSYEIDLDDFLVDYEACVAKKKYTPVHPGLE